eukprot:COSAG06_NODE_2745_length_6354_cov_59.692246_3_plen_212_part_00
MAIPELVLEKTSAWFSPTKTSNHFGGAGGTSTRVERRLCAAATEELAFLVYPEVVAVLQRVAPATCRFIRCPTPTHKTKHTHTTALVSYGQPQPVLANNNGTFASRPMKTWRRGVLALLGPQAVVTLAAFWLPSTSPTVMHLQQCMYRDSASHRAAAVCSQTRRHQRKERNETEPKEKRNCSAAWSRYTKRKRKRKRKGCLRARSWLGWLS